MIEFQKRLVWQLLEECQQSFNMCGWLFFEVVKNEFGNDIENVELSYLIADPFLDQPEH